MNVVTPQCLGCKKRGILEGVDALGYIRWLELGVEIQVALPELDADQRELLITGTHAHCWDRMFGPDDD